jgi:hypothetical protein
MGEICAVMTHLCRVPRLLGAAAHDSTEQEEPNTKGFVQPEHPRQGQPLKPGEFILGYPDENGPPAELPQPEILSRNGSYMAYRRLQEHVGKFRDFLRQHGETPEEQELIAAKLIPPAWSSNLWGGLGCSAHCPGLLLAGAPLSGKTMILS